MTVKFLTDENIATSLVKSLRENGFDVKDIKEEKLFGISDKEIIKIASFEDRIILTHDKDFANITIYPLPSHNGIVLIRYKNQSPKDVIKKFVPLIDTKLKSKMKKSLVIISDNMIKIFKAKIEGT